MFAELLIAYDQGINDPNFGRNFLLELAVCVLVITAVTCFAFYILKFVGFGNRPVARAVTAAMITLFLIILAGVLSQYLT